MSWSNLGSGTGSHPGKLFPTLAREFLDFGHTAGAVSAALSETTFCVRLDYIFDTQLLGCKRSACYFLVIAAFSSSSYRYYRYIT